ncbi:hypothetical protein [Scleromatobacter humisilvae]|uniref:Uncharacterized protein n=1 Tax=Scleromatobacter humisilvae TaxID=2897159 RepID=A0A9X1YKN9_9BURK|nr:hypothetical protein [Scleromatobacter humisilvae]MCK9688064.1 hypothetical protein [Scleromatobacter humisilvae]
MKKLSATLALVSACLSSHAIADNAALVPLRWCKNVHGQLRQQVETCGPNATEVTDISAVDPNAKVAFDRVAKAYEAQARPIGAAASAASEHPSDKEILRKGWISIFKMLGFAFVVGLVGKLMQRSFLFWFFLGVIAHIVLVAAAVISF